jgi:2-octaprenyl-6-methoxyphenol hydroxylase
MNVDYDVLIIGGGMVGGSLACAVASQGLRVGLVEAKPPPTVTHQSNYDERSLALAYGTCRVFQGLGLWESLQAKATPILTIHISERGKPGIARLSHREEGVAALGHVLAATDIGNMLATRLAELQGVDVLCPAHLETVIIRPEAAYATLRLPDRTLNCTARLLVAADGARSRVCRQLGIDHVRWDYSQTAIVANVTPKLHHRNAAYERFTASGPLALLPMSQGRCAVVCTVKNSDAEAVLSLDDNAFLAFLQARFGDRLGPFLKTGRRQGYPLLMSRSREHIRHRLAVIGNAAHTLHPVAGQGFNVGIRDVAALAEVISDAQRLGQDVGDRTVLERYNAWRRWDQGRSLLFTDGLARLFTNPWLSPMRNLGLMAFDILPAAKHLLARQTMGLEGRLPRLARGLPL